MKLDNFFNPKTVAVIGASRDKDSIGETVFKNFKENFGKNAFPINPKAKEILGVKAYASVLEVSKKIDLAVVVVPAKFVPQVLKQCILKKIKNAVIITSGFGEIGNKDLEDELKELSKHIRIIGPNCVSGSTSILVENDSHLKSFQIEDFVNNLLDKRKTINVSGTYICDISDKNFKIVSWDKGEFVPKKITKVMKRINVNDALCFSLVGGHEITCSEDHPFFIQFKDKVKKVSARDIKVGDSTFIVNNIPIKRNIVKKINLVDEIIKKVPKNKQKDIKVVYKNKRCDFNEFLKMKVNKKDLKNARLTTKHARVTVPVILPITNELCKLLGYFVADGNYKKDCLRIGYIKDVKAEIELRKCVNKVFLSSLAKDSKSKEFKFGRKIGVILFEHIFEIGKGAINKSVPSFIFSSENSKIISFLNGVYSGDGGVYLQKNKQSATLYFHSVSKKLIDQVKFLLNLLEVGPFYITCKKRQTADIKGIECKARDLYEIRTDSKQAIAQLFNLGFNFIIPIKSKKLKEIATKRGGFKTMIKEPVYLSKIKKIKRVGKSVDLYDFEVEDTHNFVAGQVVTSNCLGTFDNYSGLDCLFLPPEKLGRPRKGSIAFISQSGAVGSVVLDWMSAEGYGVSKFISYGNAVDVNEADLLEYLGKDKDTKVICMYLEGVKQGPRFMEVAKKVSKKKPIIVIKGGRTAQGSKAVSSHTGSLAGEDSVYDAAFEQTGVIRARHLIEMFNFARVLSEQPLPKGDRVLVITNGGGFGVLATDEVILKKLKLAELSEKSKKKMKKLLPDYASAGNPLDLVGDADDLRFKRALEMAEKDKNVDAIMCILLFQTAPITEKVVDYVIRFSKKKTKPLVVCSAGGEYVKKLVRKLEENDIPVFDAPARAVDSIDALVDYANIRKGKEWTYE